MNKYYCKQVTSNDLLNQMLDTVKKPKKTVEQQDNESLNTMDYYKEDNSSKNQKLEENKFKPKTILGKFQNINSRKENKKNKFPFILNQSYTGESLYELCEKTNFGLTNSFFGNKKEQNVQNRFEDRKTDNDYCGGCNSEIENTSKVCPNCLKPLCRKCLKTMFVRNLDNNLDIEHFEQNSMNEKICPNCGNNISLKDFVIQRQKRKTDSLPRFSEPLDTGKEDIFLTLPNENKQNTDFMNDFEEQNNQYDLLYKEIEDNKKHLEIKKNLHLNTLEMIKKSIEYEYNLNLKKLNEMSLKLKQIQNSMINEKNKISQQNNFNNKIELQNIFEKFRNSINILSNKYKNFHKKLMAKQNSKAYKFYESKSLPINILDTYSLKNIEILSNNRIGKAHFTIDRFVNNYVNYLNFSVSIQQDNKDSQNAIKSKIIVYMVINNKLIKLNKANKDNNKQCLNYECSLEENKAFTSKSQSNNSIKKDDIFDIKFVITELFL